MKISGSIYSSEIGTVAERAIALEEHFIDMIHVDCNDNPDVFQDIKIIKTHSSLPVDLHLITSHPSQFDGLLLETQPDLITYQFEELEEELKVPQGFKGKVGLAITSNTDVEVFKEFSDFDFILLMATVPGKSGGAFDKINFQKIRKFQSLFPGKKIHVDGGVNGEISFILRNMNVSVAVSGSYLFKAGNISKALLNLKVNEVESRYVVADFMIPLEESPVISTSEISVKNTLKAIDAGKLGFTMVLDDHHELKGIIGNADIRKAMIKFYENLSDIVLGDLINPKPITAKTDMTVVELIRMIKKQPFPVNYLPVVDGSNKAKGTITFLNLIKGEL